MGRDDPDGLEDPERELERDRVEIGRDPGLVDQPELRDVVAVLDGDSLHGARQGQNHCDLRGAVCVSDAHIKVIG